MRLDPVVDLMLLIACSPHATAAQAERAEFLALELGGADATLMLFIRRGR